MRQKKKKSRLQKRLFEGKNDLIKSLAGDPEKTKLFSFFTRSYTVYG